MYSLWFGYAPAPARVPALLLCDTRPLACVPITSTFLSLLSSHVYTQVMMRTWICDQWSSPAFHRGHLIVCSAWLVKRVHKRPHFIHVAEHLLPPSCCHRNKTPPDVSVARAVPQQVGAGEGSGFCLISPTASVQGKTPAHKRGSVRPE